MADVAGEVIRRHFRQKITIIGKDDDSPVTIADRDAETAMRELIKAAFPTHGIIGEEHGSVQTDAEYVWVLDPIDGTLSFISGSPTFGTLIALTRNGIPIMGIINQPISGERWVGANGRTTLNGTTINCRECSGLSDATLFAYGAELMEGEHGPGFLRLYNTVKRKRFGYDCYAYGLLALGFVDIIADCDMKPYDYCALVPIVENAGGKITDWTGSPLSLSNPGFVLAVGDPTLHDQAIEILG
ncbi:histidinol-phosphatase [Sneathiella sp. DP05]|uniref:Histidinol-phosphatase n=2 Tax=Sneathiella litorea TaxID=2606216 RepID=A0A6L8W2S6_9PROT|nr:histidinol-phosphatase [Sneathiella litorea]